MKVGDTARCALVAAVGLAATAGAVLAGREALATRRAVGASREQLRAAAGLL